MSNHFGCVFVSVCPTILDIGSLSLDWRLEHGILDIPNLTIVPLLIPRIHQDVLLPLAIPVTQLLVIQLLARQRETPHPPQALHQSLLRRPVRLLPRHSVLSWEFAPTRFSP